MTDTETPWVALLHQAGCRLTAPREAVISVLLNSIRPLGIQKFHVLAREQHPDLGLVTVYRTVEKLMELNLVQRIHQPDGQHAYLPVSASEEHMLLCHSCGQIAFFEGDISTPAEVIWFSCFGRDETLKQNFFATHSREFSRNGYKIRANSRNSWLRF